LQIEDHILQLNDIIEKPQGFSIKIENNFIYRFIFINIHIYKYKMKIIRSVDPNQISHQGNFTSSLEIIKNLDMSGGFYIGLHIKNFTNLHNMNGLERETRQNILRKMKDKLIIFYSDMSEWNEVLDRLRSAHQLELDRLKKQQHTIQKQIKALIGIEGYQKINNLIICDDMLNQQIKMLWIKHQDEIIIPTRYRDELYRIFMTLQSQCEELEIIHNRMEEYHESPIAMNRSRINRRVNRLICFSNQAPAAA
jgi:hypothetical protein